MIGIGGAAKPHRRLGVVRRQVAALGIDIADQRRRLGVAGQGSAAQPRLPVDQVGLHALPGHQGEAPARLCAAMPFLGRKLVIGGGGGAVLRHVQATFEDHAVKIQGGRQALLGGLTQMPQHFRLRLGLAGVARQDQGVAELALRTAAGRGFLIPAVAFLGVAQFFRTGRQDEPQHRLALGRPGLSRPPRPFGGVRVVRFRDGLAAEQAGPGVRTGIGETRPHAVQAQRGQQRLRLDVTLGRGPLDPTNPIRPARRHTGAFQVAAANPELGFRNAGARRAGQQFEGALHVAMFGLPNAPPQRRGGGNGSHQRIEESHVSLSPLEITSSWRYGALRAPA